VAQFLEPLRSVLPTQLITIHPFGG
jgi:hypothetical protein